MAVWEPWQGRFSGGEHQHSSLQSVHTALLYTLHTIHFVVCKVYSKVYNLQCALYIVYNVQWIVWKSVLRVKSMWCQVVGPPMQSTQTTVFSSPCSSSSCRLVQNTMQRPSCVSRLLGPSVRPPPSNLITQTHSGSTSQPEPPQRVHFSLWSTK